MNSSEQEQLESVRKDVYGTESVPLGEVLQYLIDEYEGSVVTPEQQVLLPEVQKDMDSQ